MELEIRSRGFELTEALRGHCERRLRFALDRFAERLGRVMVRVSDVNGPRGGLDKRCHILASTQGGGTLVIEHLATDAYEAVDQAAGRAAQTLARLLERERALGVLARDLREGRGGPEREGVASWN